MSVFRRLFLSGAGVAGGGAALIGEASSAAVADEPAGVGQGTAPIALTVNGVVHSVRLLPNATPAEALRGPLDLTGTKIGCDRGGSSACTVWLDGACVASCMVLAIDVGNRVGCHALACGPDRRGAAWTTPTSCRSSPPWCATPFAGDW
jgi:xanthine dehydrogenase YagT iron-sulfur-binding subunit